jgi:medium-chain acyl-[acyl-carrier-protein] hydrolase
MSAERWLRTFLPRPAARVRLLCFHHAGGGASTFRSWPVPCGPDVEVTAVQLPGRENRFMERPFTSMGPLVDAVLDGIGDHLDRPYAFFGYSMGARVALEVTQALAATGGPLPEALFVGASPGPALRTPVPGWDLSDAGLISYLARNGGTPAELLADQELMRLMLPTVRADLTTIATWPYQAGRVLDRPIHAFAGSHDDYATPARMRAWGRETTAPFTLTTLAGNHFFINRNRDELVASITDALAGVTGTPACLARGEGIHHA